MLTSLAADVAGENLRLRLHAGDRHKIYLNLEHDMGQDVGQDMGQDVGRALCHHHFKLK